MQPQPSLLAMFLPFLLPLVVVGMIVLVWLYFRPRKLRIGERVSVWAGAERVPATVLGGTRSSTWVRYENGVDGEVPRSAVAPLE